MASKTFFSRCVRSIIPYTRSYSSSSQPSHSNNVPSHLIWNNLRTNISNTEESKELFAKAFLCPNNACWPSLPFLLQQQDASLPGAPDSVTPMLLFPKRTYQPSNIRRKRNHGFLASEQRVVTCQELTLLLSRLAIPVKIEERQLVVDKELSHAGSERGEQELQLDRNCF